jgi:hypothetical protein
MTQLYNRTTNELKLNISKELLDKTLSFQEYLKTMETWFLEYRKSDEKDPWVVGLTNNSITAMRRLKKTYLPEMHIIKRLKKIEAPVIWLTVIDFCSIDTLPIISVVQFLSEWNDTITHKILHKDTLPEDLNQYFDEMKSSAGLKVYALKSDSLEILAEWNTRPEGAQQLIMEDKAPKILVENVRDWYVKDRGEEVANEFIDAIL